MSIPELATVGSDPVNDWVSDWVMETGLGLRALPHTVATGLLTGLMATLLLAGCASAPQVPSQSRLIVVPGYYTVKTGDTLSKIAANYGLDYQKLARINTIDSSYIIYVGQRLKLTESQNAPRLQVRTSPLPASQPLKSTPISSAGRPANTTSNQPVRQSANQPANLPTKAIGTAAVVTAPVVASAGNPTALSNSKKASYGWRWPTSNPILQTYNPSAKAKGIIFSGKLGDPVFASDSGEVIYASNGLSEYGNLILIKHGNGFISAYAHCNRMLVQENQRVTSGQQIAEMGHTGASQVQLQFQIRSNGKAIDPSSLLPAR